MPIVQHLYADLFGSHIGKYQERLKITQGGETRSQAPLMHLQGVTIASLGVSISADAIAACCERGIPIVFIDNWGEVYASLYAAGLVGTALTRRAQLAAYDDQRGFTAGIGFSSAKVRNQAVTLRYWARLRRETDLALASRLSLLADELDSGAVEMSALDPAPIESLRDTIMGYEGNAARLYWEGAGQIIPSEYGWTGRIGRGATDPINSLLNYGYGILYAEIERAIILAGLDPYAGFLHADRPGKPSLVLDLIEEFRQVAVDRPVIGLAARRYTIKQDERGMLETTTRRDFADKILKQLDAPVRCILNNNDRVPLRHAIQMQARHLATFLRGEHDHYVAFEAEG